MDQNVYYRVNERFLHAMSQIDSDAPHRVNEASAELCNFLRVAAVSVEIYENLADEKNGKKTELSLYWTTGAAKKPSLSQKHITKGYTLAVYNAFLFEDSEPWDEEERVRVSQLLEMMYIFTSRFKLFDMVAHLTFFDQDGYHNLHYYMINLERLVREKKLKGKAFLYFNLKHFSRVNQQIGRSNGSRVMKLLYERIENMLRGKGIIARVGGDNFVAMVYRSGLDNLLDLLNGDNVVYDPANGAKVKVSATAGIFVMPDDCDDFTTSTVMAGIITASQIARTNAKEDFVFYSDIISSRRARFIEMQEVFPAALKNEEFKVFYQPKIDLETGRIAGAEALCRWFRDGRIVSPGEFIPLLEHGMEICRLDFYMLDHVCRDIRRWLDEGRETVRISVNLSRNHMMDHDLLDNIIRIVDSHNVPHKWVEIELTETTTDIEFRDLKRVVSGLQSTGICTSVDDFGIGYSSLNLIKEIPWNVLKVDRSFLPLENDDENSTRSVMFRHVVTMARELGLECIAEGVETEEQVRVLKDNKCALAQGFFFDKPLPVEEFEQRLEMKQYQVV